MREILFRGKRKDNGEWVQGMNIFIITSEKSNRREISIVPSGIALLGNAENTMLTIPEIEVDPSTVGQYTGLTDKNGKRIFEGDIVLHKNQKDFIFYDEELAAFVCKDSFQKGASWLYTHEFELIGNIFENPELLKVGE